MLKTDKILVRMVRMRKKERTGKQYRRIFIDFLRRFPGITRRKINEFMMEEIRGDLTEKQKRSKMSNLMTDLRGNGKIVNGGGQGGFTLTNLEADEKSM